MASSPTRALLWFVGVAVVIVGIWMLFFQTDLQRWIPMTVLTAGVIIFVGVAVMTFADRSPTTSETVIEEPAPARRVVREEETTRRRIE
ncbi:MAG: hypothetical protein ACYDCK_09040 [Thermoplasmatota archaeon]